MIVICEECGKKYRIDETKIKGKRASFKCKACGSTIKITMPQPREEPEPRFDDFTQPLTGKMGTGPEKVGKEYAPPLSEDGPKEDRKPELPLKRKAIKTGGLSISIKLLLMFLASVVIMGFVLTFVYVKYVPSLMSKQINLRTYSVSRSFSAAALQPLLVHNYLRVNKAAEVISQLPGVAYVSVINKKGIVIAGIFGDTKRFSPGFVAKIKKEGFPKALSHQNRLPKGTKNIAKDLISGGQKIHDVAVSIGETGGEAHVGLFTADIEKEVRNALTPLMIILVALAVVGSISFVLMARAISTPIKSLTEAAQRISLGEIDHPISVKGRGEIAELAASLERMRFSIKSAIERLRRR